MTTIITVIMFPISSISKQFQHELSISMSSEFDKP